MIVFRSRSYSIPDLIWKIWIFYYHFYFRNFHNFFYYIEYTPVVNRGAEAVWSLGQSNFFGLSVGHQLTQWIWPSIYFQQALYQFRFRKSWLTFSSFKLQFDTIFESSFFLEYCESKKYSTISKILDYCESKNYSTISKILEYIESSTTHCKIF